MKFYTNRHKYYCGIDLHAKSMYVCIVDGDGKVLLHRNMRACPETLLSAITPYREDVAIAVECMFCWHWIADLCAREGITFVLGHALYMKAIHGAKAKNDRIDSEKIAQLLKGGLLPKAYVYPREMRGARDVVRRRMFLVHKRAASITPEVKKTS
jgi:transposase